MAVLLFFQQIRIPGLNEFMLVVTQFGDVLAFLLVALVVFWCVDKRWGYYILAVGFLGTLLNQFLKLLFRIPRPWLIDDRLHVLGMDSAGADGYSFPSGHAQSAVGIFGAIARLVKKRWIRVLAITIAVLVPVSRMYLGVHTPQDVLVAAVMAVFLIFVVHPLVFRKNGRYMPALLGISIAFAVGFVCFVEFYPFPETIDTNNYHHGLENAYTLLGALSGIVAVYFVDRKWLNFPVKAVWWAQIIKVVLGLVLVIAVMEGTSAVLSSILGQMLGRCVRYFLTVFTAGVIWPLTFRFFANMSVKRKGNGQ